MSFDLFLVSFRDGIAAGADAPAAQATLQRYRYSHDREFNAYYSVQFDDGSHVELYADGLDDFSGKPFDGAMFSLRGFSQAIADFIFEFARTSGCVIFPAMEPPCVLIPHEDLLAHLPADLSSDRRRISVRRGRELLAAVQGGYVAWQGYRDRVVNLSGDSPLDTS